MLVPLLSQGVSGESGPVGGPGSTGDEVKVIFLLWSLLRKLNCPFNKRKSNLSAKECY